MHQALFSTLALTVLVAPALAADSWMMNLSEALDLAAAQNKAVLVDFNGSDWCPPCQYLKQQVFSKPEFEAYAKDKLILVDIDIPNGNRLSEAQKMINRELATLYQIQGFPTVLILSKDGIIIGGFMGPKDSVDEAKVEFDKALAIKDEVDAAVAAAQKLSGLDKAKALDALTSFCPDMLRSNNVTLRAMVKEADVDDVLGYRAADQRAAEEEAAAAEVEALMSETEPAKRLAVIDEQLKRTDLTPALKSRLSWTRFDIRIRASTSVADIEKIKEDIIAFAEANPSEKKMAEKLLNGIFAIPAEQLLQRVQQIQGR